MQKVISDRCVNELSNSDVYWAYFRCCLSYEDKIRFCVLKSMSSMMADISAEFTAKLH